MITTSKSAKIIPHIVLIILTLVCLLPLLLLLMASLTDEQTLMLNGYSFFPEKFSADAYTYIFKTGKTVLRAYGITFFVTAVGTVCNVCMTVCHCLIRLHARASKVEMRSHSLCFYDAL